MPFDEEVEITTAKGNLAWVRHIGEAERDDPGTTIAVHRAMPDISELRQARHVAKRVSARLTDTFESIHEALMTVDRNWCIVLANSECARLLRHDEASLVGRSIWTVFPETKSTAFWDNCHLAMASGQTARLVECFKPVQKWSDISIFASVEGLSIFFCDVTDRLAQATQLRLLETAVARLNDVLIITDARSVAEAVKCRIVFVNDAFTRLTGYSREMAIGNSPRMWQRPCTQHDALARVREAIQQQHAIRPELINHTAPGNEFWSEVDIAPIRDEAGTLTHYVVNQRDISERKAAEAAARLQDERVRLAAEATTDVTWDWDIVKGVIWWSGAMAQTDQHTDDASGPNRDAWRDNLHRDDRDRVIASLMQVVHGAEARGKAEYRFLRGNNGGVASVMDRGFVIRNVQGTALRMIGSLTDTRVQRDLKARLRQANRLEAAGQLTGGVAHDFNNLLTVILGNAELMSARLPARPALRTLADMTANAAGCGAELTSKLLTFASRQSLEPVPPNINRLIEGMAGLLRRTPSARIGLLYDLASDLGSVLVDHGPLGNALLNLVINGRDAMPAGGLLSFATSLFWADHPPKNGLTGPVAAKPGPQAYAEISVSDSGTAMTKAVVERAFDPFFTTMGPDKGTGPGLSMVYGFARQSGGHAEITSVEGKGTTVSVFLPRTGLEAAPPVARDDAPLAPVHGTSHILLVEDDLLVPEYASQQLESLGYRVSTASDGRAAIARLERCDDVDLLLTDIVMPGGLTGYDPARIAQEWHPAFKVLFTSGFSENVPATSGAHAPKGVILKKPYRRAELALRVKTALE